MEYGFVIEKWMERVAGSWPTLEQAFEAAKHAMLDMKTGLGVEVTLGPVELGENDRWIFVSK